MSDEGRVAEVWQLRPGGRRRVMTRDDRIARKFERFLPTDEQYRRDRRRHIAEHINALDVLGKRVLEIGLDRGAEAELLCRQGAHWSGFDATEATVERVRRRLEECRLRYDDIRHGSPLALPYPDDSFDVVFTHGALDHVPQIMIAQAEINRVLRPGGELVMMVQSRWSFHYVVSILIRQRLGAAMAEGWAALSERIEQVLYPDEPAVGRWVPAMPRTGTDGLATNDGLNTEVYSLAALRRNFPFFEIARSDKRWLTYKRWARNSAWRLERLPLEQWLGWHLWVQMRPRKFRV